MLIPNRFRIVGVFAVIACAFVLAVTCGGCVDKPGTKLDINEATPVTFADPSSTQSTAVLGQQTTTTTGNLAVETSKLVDEGLYETNAGGAAKQRGAFQIGRVRAILSGASDLDIAGVELVFDEAGEVSIVKVSKIATSNSAVQRAVNEGVGLLVAQWQRSSDNERAVLERQIEAQAKLGDAVATTALSVVKLLKGVP